MFLSLLLALAAQAASPAPVSMPAAAPKDWAAIAKGDVEAGFEMMKGSHAGWYNDEDPGFRTTLERARDAGLAAASSASDPAGYARALNAFSAVLGDGHALLRANDSGNKSEQRWPGFVTAWRGNALYVVDGEAAPGLGFGARVVSCEGVPIADYIVRRLEGRKPRLGEQGEWWAYSAMALLDDSAQANGPAPQHCDIAPAAGGAAQTVALSYQSQPKDMMRRFWDAANGAYHDIGLTEPRPGLFVIGLPTFEVDEQGGALYAALTKEIRAQHGKLANARAIVLDLRRNQGGSSNWPTIVAEALWGEEAVDSRRRARNHALEIKWRTSADNIAYLASIDPILRKQGQATIADEVAELRKEMEAAAARGEPLIAEEKAASRPAPPPPARTSLTTPVYVIVPGQCASACLDALDIFSEMPNVQRIGAPSAADSLYMEVRQADLPSGEGFAVIPLKVWQHRNRGAGFVYQPNIKLMQADWSTKAFLDAIESDLPKRGMTR